MPESQHTPVYFKPMHWAVSGVKSCLVGSGPLLWVCTVGIEGGMWASQSSPSFTCIYLFSKPNPGLKWVFLVPFSCMSFTASATLLCSLACLLPELLLDNLQLFYQLALQEKLSRGSLAEQANPFPSTGAQHSLTAKAAAVSYQPCWNNRLDERVSLLCLLQCWPKAVWKYSKSLFNSSSRSSYDFRESLVPLKARWCMFDCWEERCWTTTA